MRAKYITLPGIGGSDEKHWQTLWERNDSGFRRFNPSSWDVPELQDWLVAVDCEVSSAGECAVLVAHSLACLLVAHWAQTRRHRVAGALLVALPDPHGPNFPSAAASFREVPTAALPFPALVIASTDDSYGTIDYARLRANQWNTGIVEIGPLGHIGTASGLGDWQQGRMLLDTFCAGLAKMPKRDQTSNRTAIPQARS